MEKRAIASSILLIMLSLEAVLLTASLTAAAANPSDKDLIRLPSDTKLGLAAENTATATATAATTGDDEERPWKCCDLQVCATTYPLTCMCYDRVKQCSDACKDCKEVVDSDPPLYFCADKYTGDPAPSCKRSQGRKIIHRGTETMAVVRGANNKGRNGEDRPWKCCDKAITGPTTEGTVVWYCMDKVDKCTSCDRCLELEAEGDCRYFCLDGYQGRDPGPSCTYP